MTAPHYYARYYIEPVTFIMRNNMPFWAGNVIKYVCRAPYKHATETEDLIKAKRYLEMALSVLDEAGKLPTFPHPEIKGFAISPADFLTHAFLPQWANDTVQEVCMAVACIGEVNGPWKVVYIRRAITSLDGHLEMLELQKQTKPELWKTL